MIKRKNLLFKENQSQSQRKSCNLDLAILNLFTEDI